MNVRTDLYQQHLKTSHIYGDNFSTATFLHYLENLSTTSVYLKLLTYFTGMKVKNID